MKTKTFNIHTITFIVITIIALTACSGQKEKEEKVKRRGHTNDELKLSGDKTVYGLACDGCSDSVIVLLPNDGSDPIRYNVIKAHRNHRIIGRMQIGDWIGVVLNEKDSTVADMAIDLDELKGTWCYKVMPTMKQMPGGKKQGQIMPEMTDSMREMLFVPREYGFTLKRQWQASTVGMTFSQNILEQDSPVEYPPLKTYTSWHIWNGKLVLTHTDKEKGQAANGKSQTANKNSQVATENDTIEILQMMKDTLVLQTGNTIQGYYRKASAAEANVEARKAAAKKSKQALEETKESSE